MTNKADLLGEKDLITGSWFNFDKIGDILVGTYVNKGHVPSKYHAEDDEVYEIKTDDGDIHLVRERQCIKDDMRNIRLGQIVKFVFMSEKDTGKGNPFKDINVYANREVVDEEWLQEQEEKVSAMGDDATPTDATPKEEIDVKDIKFVEPGNGDSPVMTDEQMLAQIIELGKTKLGAKDDEEAKIKVMEKTEMPLTPKNYSQIIGIMELTS